jgi:hypothetical protein
MVLHVIHETSSHNVIQYVATRFSAPNWGLGEGLKFLTAESQLVTELEEERVQWWALVSTGIS